MKKNIITLVALLVILGGALAAFFLLQNSDEPAVEETSAADDIYVLGGIPAPFVKQVSIENTQDSYTIKNNFENAIQQQNADSSAPGYSLEGIDVDDLNQTTLKSVMTNVGNMTAKQVVQAGDDLSLYGLDDPQATVAVTYEDGAATMEVGDEAPGSEGTYVRVDGTVYLVASTKLNNMLGSRYDFVGRTITGGNAEQSTFTRIALSGGKFTEPVVLETAAEESEASAMMGYGSYQISAPFVAGVDLDKGITPLSTLFGVSASAVVADAGDKGEAALAPYGLSPAYMTAEVETDDPDVGSFTLSVSVPDEEGNVYLISSEKSFVYQVDASLLSWMELDLFTLREKMIVLPFIDTVAEVEVATPDGTYTFVLAEEGDDLAVRVNGEELDSSNFRKFYQTLIAASYDSEIPAADMAEYEDATDGETDGEEADADPAADDADDADDSGQEGDNPAQDDADDDTADSDSPDDSAAYNAQPDQAPLMTYTYRYRDGSAENVVKFWQATARRYFIALDDGPIYYARSVYVDRVLEDLPKVVEGQEVKSYL